MKMALEQNMVGHNWMAGPETSSFVLLCFEQLENGCSSVANFEFPSIIECVHWHSFGRRKFWLF
jgi:hypothetical protein